jgi:hypothetical protein
MATTARALATQMEADILKDMGESASSREPLQGMGAQDARGSTATVEGNAGYARPLVAAVHIQESGCRAH